MVSETRTGGECVSLRHASIVGAISLVLGGVLLALNLGLVSSMLSGIPHGIFEAVGFVAEVGLFVALGKKLLGLCPMYNRTRVWLFIGSLGALLFAMAEPGHCNGPLFVQKAGQLVMLLYFLLVWKPLHGPFVRCPWRWAFGVKGLVLCFLLGKWVTLVLPEAPCAASNWWLVLGLSGAVVTFVAMVLAAAQKWDTHGVTFLSVYGVGNALLALSNLGEHQYSGPALCITSALVAVVCWALIEKVLRWLHTYWKAEAEAKAEKCVPLSVDVIPVGEVVLVRVALPVIDPVEGEVPVAERVPVAPPVVAQE